MTRVDFYILSHAEPSARDRYACRLVQKAWELGHRVYLHMDEEAHARQLDELLWTFDQGSFIPHRFLREPASCEEPVILGCGEQAPPDTEVLINLGTEVPPFFSQFERVAELVGGDQAHRELGRERYRFYRERGYPLHDHRI